MEKMNTVGWFEIYVDDMGRAKRFYEGVFQTELSQLKNPGTAENDIEMWAFEGDMKSYGANGALVKMSGMPSGHNSVLVYFSCEDCAIEEARVAEFGGKVERSKFSIGEYGFIAIASDSEGNTIGLHSLK